MRILIALFSFLTAFQAASAAPNLILFLADDLGYGDLGCFGHPTIQSPNLDAFARQGVRLTQCYSGSAVCSPSRSALLTGRTPHRNGVYTWIAEGSEVHLRTSEVTLPVLLKKAGYSTCHSGKWHLNGLFNNPAQPQPGDHGYDWWLATQNNAAPTHENPVNFARNGQAAGPMQGYSAPLVVEEAVMWLKEKRDAAKPFFLAVWTHEPHYPIKSDPKFKALYPDLTDDVQREHHANVTQMDHAFGSLMKALEEQSYYVNMTRPRASRTIDPAKTLILLVEDDATTRNILNFILTRSEGYQTRLAGDVKGFVAALQKKPLPDVVILDIELPGGVSGFKILQKIRSHPVIRDMPVIIFTGHSEPGDLLQGLALGVDAYLSKPAKAEAILAAIKAVLGG